MNPIPELKRFIVRALFRLHGLPWPDVLLEEAARQAILPRPLLSDIHQAKRELESDGYILGQRDELDGELSWSLTPKGRHKAAQLG
jgi:hypothetical protein